MNFNENGSLKSEHILNPVSGLGSLHQKPPLTTTPQSESVRDAAVLVGIMASPLLAQGNSPWENAVTVLMNAFTTTIARGLSLVSIVVGGLMFAFDEGGSKKMMAGIIFGVGMAIGAVNFMAWLFP